MNTQQKEIPEGYMENAAGHLVPVSTIREQDLLRDQLVNELTPKAIALSKALADFKAEALKDIDDLIAIAGERYNTSLGGKKGNVTLVSYNGKYKIQRTFRELISFSEELEAAKAIIDSCLARWSEGANDNIRAVVTQAFRTNTKGEIKTGKVLDLMRLDIDDEEWNLGMTALKDALKNVGTAVYIRVYERIENTDTYMPISLDIATL